MIPRPSQSGQESAKSAIVGTPVAPHVHTVQESMR